MSNHSYLQIAIDCFENRSTIAYPKIISFDTYREYYLPYYDVTDEESFDISIFYPQDKIDSVIEHCINFCLILAAIEGEI